MSKTPDDFTFDMAHRHRWINPMSGGSPIYNDPICQFCGIHPPAPVEVIRSPEEGGEYVAGFRAGWKAAMQWAARPFTPEEPWGGEDYAQKRFTNNLPDFGQQLATKGGPIDPEIERRIIERGG